MADFQGPEGFTAESFTFEAADKHRDNLRGNKPVRAIIAIKEEKDLDVVWFDRLTDISWDPMIEMPNSARIVYFSYRDDDYEIVWVYRIEVDEAGDEYEQSVSQIRSVMELLPIKLQDKLRNDILEAAKDGGDYVRHLREELAAVRFRLLALSEYNEELRNQNR